MPANPAMPLAREIWGNSFGQEFLFCWHIKQSWQVGNKGKEAEVHQGEKKLTFTLLKCQTFLVFLRKRGQKKSFGTRRRTIPRVSFVSHLGLFHLVLFYILLEPRKVMSEVTFLVLRFFNEFNYIEHQLFEKRKSLFWRKKKADVMKLEMFTPWESGSSKLRCHYLFTSHKPAVFCHHHSEASFGALL